ncbi:MAG: ImmA/IrrE family metallo-endopeptidase [Phycisphaerales bacterium]|nr:ImmA/IrrE family metallo-endopeptidase [Phycisphaerales bacterium]
MTIREAVRAKARTIIREFHQIFGHAPLFNLHRWLCGLEVIRGTAPIQQGFRDMALEADGRVVLRVNRDRPTTRQRFSIGHEIGHTLFPEYEVSVRCRKATDRDWANPDDLLETLCDVASSEFLFPEPWFHKRVADMTLSAAEIVGLAKDYQASPDATVRRLVEVHPQPLAAVFLTWKLKPTEIRQRANDRNQQSMFADDPIPEPARKLRVDYAIVGSLFSKKFGDHIPKDKSTPCEGPIHQASLSQEPCDGALFLDLGTVARTFVVHAIPIYTPEESVGPDGGVSVVAVLRPDSK